MTSKIVQFTPKTNKVEKDKVVTLKYALFESENDEVLEYREDLSYLHGGYEDLLVNLQDALTGHEVGEKIEVVLSAEKAFGPHLEELLMSGAADQFPDEAQQLWTRIQGQADDGSTREFVVTHVEDGMITVDGNHPYAGKSLRFVVEILNIRRATAEEIKKGHTVKL
ncbi:FKBP-type peptidyl-prolyl cis-trans isomerase SlyD [hydrothermal vent metagenome]|uniref:peptidylprolyl isomerase n=1 Tax=hydrothermal vent metagenome TaxID=652676 RepID=A0A3B0YD17_9ZZZZ